MQIMLLLLLLLRLTLQKIFLLSGSLTRSYITTPRETGSCAQQQQQQHADHELACYVIQHAYVTP
jgi:hypothetical protein